MKARCPKCDRLVRIHDTGIAQKPGKSSRWWQIEKHPIRDGHAELCPGGESLV